jgi:acetylornithine/succinyldiaminopimelate/putrescine aminotransferase
MVAKVIYMYMLAKLKDVCPSEEIMSHILLFADKMGTILRANLEGLKSPLITTVRGRGLLNAIVIRPTVLKVKTQLQMMTPPCFFTKHTGKKHIQELVGVYSPTKKQAAVHNSLPLHGLYLMT